MRFAQSVHDSIIGLRHWRMFNSKVTCESVSLLIIDVCADYFLAFFSSLGGSCSSCGEWIDVDRKRRKNNRKHRKDVFWKAILDAK